METQTERVVQADEGDGQPATAITEGALWNADGTAKEGGLPAGVIEYRGTRGLTNPPPRTAPEGYENVAPELWPDEDGKPPKLTEALMRQLRGKYFTVKHPRLETCGHKYDPINEPRHRNCENCWFQFLNTHPQLVETADQFFRTQGKKAMIGMRGEHFVKMFVRYMATVIHMMNEERALNVAHSQERIDAGSIDGSQEGNEAGASTSGVNESGEAVSSLGSGSGVEQDVRLQASPEDGQASSGPSSIDPA
jgi:hypothetical protein